MGGCTGCGNLVLIGCLMTCCYVTFSTGDNTTAVGPAPIASVGVVPHKPHHHPQELTCFFCTTDLNKQCGAEPELHGVELTRNCTNETFSSFRKEIIVSNPQNPIPSKARFEYTVDDPRVEWACYTVHRGNRYVLRTCVPVTHNDPNGCVECMYDGLASKCCICRENLCNDDSNLNSGALRKLIYSGLLVLLLITLEIL